MANIGIFTINTNGEYVDIATATGETFTEGTTYTMQAQNGGSVLTVCVASSQPTEGGFQIKDLEKFTYTPKSGADLYLFTGGLGNVKLNISD